MATLLVKNIGCLQTPVGSYSHKGKQQAENLKLQNAAILIEDGIIKEITSDGILPSEAEDAETVIDAEGNLVTPGLVEGHTHMVFGGYRQNRDSPQTERRRLLRHSQSRRRHSGHCQKDPSGKF